MSVCAHIHTQVSAAAVYTNAGCWADFTIAEEEWLAAVPPKVSLRREAGAIPLVSLTAWQASMA